MNVPGSPYSCAQQQGWGKCNASWMLSGNYCALTCGRCAQSAPSPSPPPPPPPPPPPRPKPHPKPHAKPHAKPHPKPHPKPHRKPTVPGKIPASCLSVQLQSVRTLNYACSAAACADVAPPPGQYSCAQQKGWGKCGASWMAGYCLVTCGTCKASTPAPASASAPTATILAAPSAGEGGYHANLSAHVSQRC